MDLSSSDRTFLYIPCLWSKGVREDLHKSRGIKPLLSTYLDKTTIQKDTRTPMLTAALFTIPKTWKQPKCPWTDDWIKKIWYIYTKEYYSAIKKEQNNAIHSSIDATRDYHTK